MFSNLAYEALYEYLGLALHMKFVEAITSHKVFMAVALMIFAVMFFMTTLRFFSRYMPGALVQRKSVPLSKYAKIVFFLFLGMSLLKIGSNTGVKNFRGVSWHQNEYVQRNISDVRSEYRVSFIFDLLSRTAEEVAALLTRIIDDLFKSKHSQLDAPNFFYRAIAYAGASTIKDEALREKMEFYSKECVERVLPLLDNLAGVNRLDSVFGGDRYVDQRLGGLTLNIPGHPGYTCLDAKNDVRSGLLQYVRKEAKGFNSILNTYVDGQGIINETTWTNLQMSSALVDHYLDEREGFLGIQEGSKPPSGAGRIYQYLNRIFSWDFLTSVVGGREGHGAAIAANRAQEFSENLTRAPHVAGFIKMGLIAFFPWLVFIVIAGYWRALLYWFFIYLSVLLWTPIWTLFYHITLNISLSAEVMTAFGRLSDGVSLYSASLITSRMNYLFAVYSWLQLLIGVGFTGIFLWVLRPLLSDKEEESAPEFISEGSRAAGVVSKLI